ncbi:hypothetical protein XO12_09915, partial [Marinitoga sp. 1154]|uniref:flagellar hook-length control protein FliK n=1 Tax=Marinitoga sp. 1154 TaxID=1643335 RepID=UPI00158625BD
NGKTDFKLIEEIKVENKIENIEKKGQKEGVKIKEIFATEEVKNKKIETKNTEKIKGKINKIIKEIIEKENKLPEGIKKEDYIFYKEKLGLIVPKLDEAILLITQKNVISSNILKKDKNEIIKVKFNTGLVGYIENNKKEKMKLILLNEKTKKIDNTDSNIDILKSDLKSIIENKIKIFKRSNEKNKILYSDEKMDLLIAKRSLEKNTLKKVLKEKTSITSKNIMSNVKIIKKIILDDAEIILKKKNSDINVKNIIKYMDSITYKIYKNDYKEGEKNILNLKTLNKYRGKTNLNSNNVNYLHPLIELNNSSNKNNNVYVKTVSLNKILPEMQNLIEKAENFPKYFERTVFKINPPDLGNIEITIIKSHKNVKIQFSLENNENRKELEKRIEPLLINLKEKYEKVEFLFESEVEKQNKENHNNDRNNNEEEKFSDENKSSKKHEKKKSEDKQFFNILRGEYYD